MTTEMLMVWHCDAAGCTASAPEKTEGWTNAAYTHGCPDHAEAIAAHRADKTHHTRGRGRSEKTTWFLACGCGWRPTPNWETYNANWLHKKHLEHVRAMTTVSDA